MPDLESVDVSLFRPLLFRRPVEFVLFEFFTSVVDDDDESS